MSTTFPTTLLLAGRHFFSYEHFGMFQRRPGHSLSWTLPCNFHCPWKPWVSQGTQVIRAPKPSGALFGLSNFPTKKAVLTAEREEVLLRLTQHGNKDLLVGREVPAVIRNLMTVCRWCSPCRLPPPSPVLFRFSVTCEHSVWVGGSQRHARCHL